MTDMTHHPESLVGGMVLYVLSVISKRTKPTFTQNDDEGPELKRLQAMVIILD
jgi:hypothetical protein